jgi:hypothetical protein
MKMTDKEVVRYIIRRLRCDAKKRNFRISGQIFRYIRDFIDYKRDMEFLANAEHEARKNGLQFNGDILLRYYDLTRPEEISFKKLNLLYNTCKLLLIKEKLIY